MKHAIFGTVLFGITILSIFIITTLSGRMTREAEINSTLTLALNQAIDNVMLEKKYTIQDNEEFVSDVIETLTYSYHSESEIEIKVAGIDYNKGLLSLEVIEHYTNPNGKSGMCKLTKTVLFEEGIESVYFKIVYKVNDKIVSEFKVLNGDKCEIPNAKDTTITEWYLNGEKITNDEIKELVVTENIVFTNEK